MCKKNATSRRKREIDGILGVAKAFVLLDAIVFAITTSIMNTNIMRRVQKTSSTIDYRRKKGMGDS